MRTAFHIHKKSHHLDRAIWARIEKQFLTPFVPELIPLEIFLNLHVTRLRPSHHNTLLKCLHNAKALPYIHAAMRLSFGVPTPYHVWSFSMASCNGVFMLEFSFVRAANMPSLTTGKGNTTWQTNTSHNNYIRTLNSGLWLLWECHTNIRTCKQC